MHAIRRALDVWWVTRWRRRRTDLKVSVLCWVKGAKRFQRWMGLRQRCQMRIRRPQHVRRSENVVRLVLGGVAPSRVVGVDMSSISTAISPSYAGGGGGKRGRGGDDGGRDRRRPDKPKPVDKISAADLGPDGRLRQLILNMLQLANLGDLPSGSLLTRGGQPKTLNDRSAAVGRWVQGHLHASDGLIQARYSEMAEAFVHTLRAVNAAGLFDQLLAMLVELLTNRAVDRADLEDDDHEDD